MGICVDAACAGCPEWVITLAVVGGALIYVLIGFLIYSIIKAFIEDIDSDFVIICIFFWPILIVGAVVVGIVYYIARLIAMPIIGADKYDLKVLGDKMEDTIDTKITREDNKIMRYLESDYVPPKAKRKAKEPAKVSKKKVKKGKK